ncbi:Cell division control protein 48 B [Chlorella vulgaris]
MNAAHPCSMQIDALCPRRDSARSHEARIVAQLLTLLDGAAGRNAISARYPRLDIVIVAATSRPNAVDPALRRPGRFDVEIMVPPPDATARASILQVLIQHLPLHEPLDLTQLASDCHGYTGADLGALCREAAMNAASKGAASVGGTISAGDFVAAMKRVGPSLARGATAPFEAVSWNDIGGLWSVKQRLKQAVEWPLRHADAFRRLALSPPRGILLHGPPGCCKTTLVRAAASASGATLICLSGTQLYSMYVGQGEALLRDSFKRARLVAPSILFLDEVDSIVGKRSSHERGADMSARLLTSLLSEMDGLERAEGILVMGATNRPQALDAALTRPGRFDLTMYVPPPDEQGRLQALRIHSRTIPLAPDVDLSYIATCTGCFTGAELAAVCREAALAALREDVMQVRSLEV